MQVSIENDADAAQRLVDLGYCPVEASYGHRSVVDELAMDHHGAFSEQRSVADRAWREHYGARAEDPRFVVAGELDPDAAFAMAALAGIVPAPSSSAADRVAEVVEVIDLVDIDPIGRDLTAMPGFAELRLWSLLGRTRDADLATAGVLLWQLLFASPREKLQPLLDAAVASEHQRRATALADLERVVHTTGDGRVAVLDQPHTWGFDVWYGRDEGRDRNDPAAWRHWVVLTRSEEGGVTVGLPNKEVAEALLGDGGLLNVFDELTPPGWGGREAIGGGPRDGGVTLEQTIAASEVIARRLAG